MLFLVVGELNPFCDHLYQKCQEKSDPFEDKEVVVTCGDEDGLMASPCLRARLLRFMRCLFLMWPMTIQGEVDIRRRTHLSSNRCCTVSKKLARSPSIVQ